MLLTHPWLRFVGPLAVTVLAAVLRLWNLGTPHSLVFDETFYVKDAWSLFNNGYESTWPDNADARFAAGETNIFTTEGSFVVHPPLGKWLIALGMAAFGADSSWGWRIATALIGILAVVLLMLIARRLFGSVTLATIAGFLFAIDGNAIVMSRVALLDNSVMFFTLLGFGAILLDRGWHERRLAGWLMQRREAGLDPSWGPALWWRPWLIGAGLAFGLASSVKWSGFYFVAAFGVYVVVVDALARRRAGVPFWLSGAVLKQGPVSFVLLVPIAVTTLVVSWTGWLVTQGGFYRQFASEPGAAWTGPLSWVPHVWQSFWHYQVAIYNYHVGLSTPHPYQANPLTWLLMNRPTSMFYEGTTLGQNGCASAKCSEAILDVANPLIWWAAGAATLYLVYRFARYRQWQVGLILMGMVAGYLPWLMYLNRTVFQFYTIAFEPYLLLGLVWVIGMLLGKVPQPEALDAVTVGEDGARGRSAVGLRLVGVFLGAALLLSLFFYPIWTGMQTPLWFWQLHMWLPSWV
ncbi:dolichyl-phosphate-mannose--protein mannosyltransferase [Glaciibacter psychrotolerans]|uniref:dolichyl-phosphate-mannose--protein mannosyltransferase n=1 Tax=Glaciibacter psychrotolerans TaxID=670054 RepID=UPI0031B5D1AC